MKAKSSCVGIVSIAHCDYSLTDSGSFPMVGHISVNEGMNFAAASVNLHKDMISQLNGMIEFFLDI